MKHKLTVRQKEVLELLAEDSDRILVERESQTTSGRPLTWWTITGCVGDVSLATVKSLWIHGYLKYIKPPHPRDLLKYTITPKGRQVLND